MGWGVREVGGMGVLREEGGGAWSLGFHAVLPYEVATTISLHPSQWTEAPCGVLLLSGLVVFGPSGWD